MVAARAREHYDQEAKGRQGTRSDLGSNILEKLPEGSKGTARDKAGAAVGVSGKTVDAWRS